MSDDKTIFIPRPHLNKTVHSAEVQLGNLDSLQTLSSFEDKYHHNSVISCAYKLVSLIGVIRQLEQVEDIKFFHEQLQDELKNFNRKLTEINTAEEQRITARYMICAALDEAVINTPWGMSSGWSQHSMLKTFHNDSAGGEKFFAILEKLLTSPEKYADLLELGYTLIALGFKGKYKTSASGNTSLESIQEKIYQTLSPYRTLNDGSEEQTTDLIERNHLSRLIPVWAIALCFVIVSAIAFGIFQYTLSNHASIATDELEQQLQLLERPL